MNIKNAIENLHKIRYKKLSEEKVILIYKDKKEIDAILKEWTSELKGLAWETDTGLLASYNRLTGTLTVKYRFQRAEIKQICAYDYYVILAGLTANDNGMYELRYSFVYERFLDISFKVLGILMLCPLIFTVIERNNLQFDLGDYIFILIFAGILALVGAVLFFMKRPGPEQCFKMIGLFEDDMQKLL